MRPKQRAHPRQSVKIRVLTASGEDQGEGTLVDISLNGALVESRDFRPRLGAPIKIIVPTKRGGSEEILGTVARHATRGFAIQFMQATALVRRIVELGKVDL